MTIRCRSEGHGAVVAPHTIRPAERPTYTAMSVAQLGVALGLPVDVLETSDGGKDRPVRSVMLADSTDLAAETDADQPSADLYLHVGVDASQATTWLTMLARRHRECRPVALLSKEASHPDVREAARRTGVVLLAIPAQARWDRVYSAVDAALQASHLQSRFATGLETVTYRADLFDLAHSVARNVGGIVSIEDVHSKVLAYSASGGLADELRINSILEQQGPRKYLRALRQWGVLDRLRESDDMIDVPANPGLGTKRRAVVAIRHHGIAASSPVFLGAIWVQEGAGPLAAAASELLRGAAAVAARIISGGMTAPSAEESLRRQLFGGHGDLDVSAFRRTFNFTVSGAGAVVGFTEHSAEETPHPGIDGPGQLLRLHAHAYRPDAIVGAVGPRVYVYLPQCKSDTSVLTWTSQLVARLEQQGVVLRAAVSCPVEQITDVSVARAEVDRVLDRTVGGFPEHRVSTLADALTPVLLSEALSLIGERTALRDPRVVALRDYDRDHDGSLCASVWSYLEHFGEVRAAAAVLTIHPNTLRYRLRRAEQILGMDLTHQPDRLHLEMQLAAERVR